MANRYWVGGTAAWDATAGTKWALTSGAAGGSAVPTTSDIAFFDAASGTVSVDVVGAQVCASFNCTGFTGTITGSSTPSITISGTPCYISSGMTIGAGFPTLAFTGTTTTTTFTSNGKTLNAITINGSTRTVSLADPLTCGLITLTLGNFNANGHAVNITGLSSSNSNVRILTMGSGTWTVGGSATTTLWVIGTTNLTFTSSGSTLIFNPSNAVGYSISVGTMTNDAAVTILAGVAGGRVSIGGGTWNNLTVNGPNRLVMSTAFTMNGAFNGRAGGVISLEAVNATAITVTTTTGITGKNVLAMDVTKAGAGTIVFAPCWDAGGNTGITCNPGLIKASSRVGMV